jgi:protein SCO1/2
LATQERLPSFGDVPHFQLTAQSGQVFDSAALKGKIWVADFIYTTCPGPCPRMTSQMRRVRKETAKLPDVSVVSFTVDPEHDTPAVLADYAKQYHAPDSWFFLTGPRATLQLLCKDVFKLGNVDGSLLHSTRFVLIDRKAQIRGYYDTSEESAIPKLISDVEALEKEPA